MRQELHLFLGDKEIEFNQPPELLYNYTENDLKNPSIVKNSYSKTLTIEGTPNNNQIFGHFWNLERIQEYGTGSYFGSYFNPLQKANFTLYLNGEIYESGYFKLDKVKKNGNNITYDITLFGGLGSFFYNLTYSHTANEEGKTEVTGPDKLTLADLDYTPDGNQTVNLDFTINKETVNRAWNTIIGGDPDYDDKFRYINFMPCYNGKPKDFDANKVIINNKSFPSKAIPSSVTGDDGKTYRGYNPKTPNITTAGGYTLAETSEELTEWEAGNDLRSYNQRPVFNVKALIDACCKPENNMGYEVQLDETFFNSENPYYNNAWMTLPMLKDLDIKRKSETITSATVEKDGDLYNIKVNGSTPFATYSNLEVGVKVAFTPKEALPVDVLYTNHYYFYDKKKYFYEYDEIFNAGAILVQLVAFNEVGDVVATSGLNFLSSQRAADDAFYDTDFDTFKKSWFGNWTAEVPRVVYRKGYFRKDTDGKYYWCNYSGSMEALSFTLYGDTKFASVSIRMKALRNYMSKDWSHQFLSWHSGTVGPGVHPLTELYNPKYFVEEYQKGQPSHPRTGMHDGTFEVVLDANHISLTADAPEGLFSGTKITAKDLLTTDKTPCDYLLSYCKQFGLYFYKDANESARDPERCPNGVIHIMTRNEFYDINNIVNLEKYIDRKKPIEITPQIPATKWYDWGLKVEDSQAELDYVKATNMPFGTHRLNTGYNFNADKTDIFKDNAFKGGITVLEKDKYFQLPDYTSGSAMEGYPTYAYNGLKVTLYNKTLNTDLATQEVEFGAMTLPTARPINPRTEYKGYDTAPRLQFHKEKNEPTDGSGVLVFFNGGTPSWNPDNIDAKIYGKIKYWITDDNEAMQDLNDGKACWLMTDSETDINGDRIAIKRSNIPYFSRYRYYDSTNIITHTWDMDRSRGFVPYLQESDEMGIYSKCWKDFASDLYSINTKQLTCYCLLENRPNPEWLRRFYWFDNSIWRLNKIVDWNVSSYETTKMEFVKVQDLNNYQFQYIDNQGNFYIRLKQDKIGAEGGVVEGYMYAQDMGFLEIEGVVVEYADGTTEYLPAEDCIDNPSGEGYVNFRFTAPANLTEMERRFKFTLPKWIAGRKIIETYLTQNAGKMEFPIKFSTGSMAMPYEGKDDVEIQYAVKEGVTNLSIASDVAWITPMFEGDGWIVFHVSPNPDYVNRTGKLILSGKYDGKNYSAECDIVQSGRPRVVHSLNKKEVIADRLIFDTTTGVIKRELKTDLDIDTAEKVEKEEFIDTLN